MTSDVTGTKRNTVYCKTIETAVIVVLRLAWYPWRPQWHLPSWSNIRTEEYKLIVTQLALTEIIEGQQSSKNQPIYYF